MHRFKDGIRRLFALPGKAWRRFGSSQNGSDGPKFSRFVFVVVGLLVLFIGWRTVTTIQRLSSTDLLFVGGDPEAPGVHMTLSGSNSAVPEVPSNDTRGEPVLTVTPPPAPDVPEQPKPFHFTHLVHPVADYNLIGPGWRRSAETAFWYYESAFVLQAPMGSAVVAAGPGIVTDVTPTVGSAGGWSVTIEHDDDFTTVYDNVFDVEVAPGNAVSAHTRLGQVRNRSLRDGLAPAGATPSISFAVVHEGEVVDSMALLSDR